MVILAGLVPMDAQALPAFARQTGQNCVSCHAGGQFPELTPYGRLFKLTGYTMGARALPLAVMGVFNSARVANTSKSDDPASDFTKNGTPVFSSASLFIAGKVTDNIGLFSQITYDNYASGPDTNGNFHGHTSADNIDLRFADRFIDAKQDLIFGLSLNNNPSVTDPWNTAPAWTQYVPPASLSSHQFGDASAPFPGFDAAASPLVGINAYAYWNKTVYGELGFYGTADRAFSILRAGIPGSDTQHLKGMNNPYWRVALTREWGAHNLMVGTTGMVAHTYDLGSDLSDPNNLGSFRNVGIDAQYQYLLDPHTFTVAAAFMREKQVYSANAMAGAESPYFLADGTTPVAAPKSSDSDSVFRAKATYVYQAKYGGSLAFFNKSGNTNSLNQSSGYDSMGQITSMDPNGTGIMSTRVNGNLSGNPGTRGMTYEAFWIPLQYVRLGLQYTAYSKFNGAANNYDGFGRNARDNNTLFGYAWFAF
ncbi:MAG: cytochrome C [Betaproteobacteria bacterium]